MRRNLPITLRVSLRLLATIALLTMAGAGTLRAGENWPLFRGDTQCTGVTVAKLPDRLDLMWTFRVDGGAFEGTPAIADGVVYLGDLDGKLFALNLADGTQRWLHELIKSHHDRHGIPREPKKDTALE